MNPFRPALWPRGAGLWARESDFRQSDRLVQTDEPHLDAWAQTPFLWSEGLAEPAWDDVGNEVGAEVGSRDGLGGETAGIGELGRAGNCGNPGDCSGLGTPPDLEGRGRIGGSRTPAKSNPETGADGAAASAPLRGAHGLRGRDASCGVSARDDQQRSASVSPQATSPGASPGALAGGLVDEILRLRAEELSYQAIARRVKLSRHQVSAICRSVGAGGGSGAPLRSARRLRSAMDPRLVAEILRLRQECKTVREIEAELRAGGWDRVPGKTTIHCIIREKQQGRPGEGAWGFGRPCTGDVPTGRSGGCGENSCRAGKEEPGAGADEGPIQCLVRQPGGSPGLATVDYQIKTVEGAENAESAVPEELKEPGIPGGAMASTFVGQGPGSKHSSAVSLARDSGADSAGMGALIGNRGSPDPDTPRTALSSPCPLLLVRPRIPRSLRTILGDPGASYPKIQHPWEPIPASTAPLPDAFGELRTRNTLYAPESAERGSGPSRAESLSTQATEAVQASPPPARELQSSREVQTYGPGAPTQFPLRAPALGDTPDPSPARASAPGQRENPDGGPPLFAEKLAGGPFRSHVPDRDERWGPWGY